MFRDCGAMDTTEFPGTITESLHLLVVQDAARSRDFYTQRLGAQVIREMAGVLAFLDLAGVRLVLSAAGPGTADKPTVAFAAPADPDNVSAELILRVTDTRAVHQALAGRGVQFFTDPVDFGWEIRCYLRDPDGHLIELTQPSSGA